MDNYIKNWQEVVDHVLKTYPEEACGIITHDNIFVPKPNLAENRLEAFELDPLELDAARAILHSHTIDKTPLTHDPRSPSKADLQGQIDTGVEWCIVVTEGENVTQPIWWGDYNHRPQLLVRDFIPNVQDCLSFVADWLYVDLRFKLKPFARDPNWLELGENPFANHEDFGFFETTEPPARGDLVLYNIRTPVPSHIGVLAEPNTVAHHLPGRMPIIEPFAVWSKFVTKRLRRL